MNFSSIGFGCYRVDFNIREHYDALYKALTNGITLIDTSANYYDGGSEILVGKVVDELTSQKKIKRENLTIVTKAGYIQGQNLKLASQRKLDGKSFEEIVEESDKLWHCIHPDFIEDQLNRQLHRLQQNYVDAYLLHNPEYYLNRAEKNDIELSDAREIYYERIRKAFEFLETKSGEGEILSYGISSNTFGSHSSQYDFTSLERVLNIANSISLNNSFKFIQLPFNLFETGAIVNKNQINNTETVLELAFKANLNVLVNRPLNAISSKGLVRLADFKWDAFQEKDFIKQMKLVLQMENDLFNEKILSENLSDENINSVKKNLMFGKTVEENWKFFGSIEHYNDMLQQLFKPRIKHLINFFDEKISDKNTKEYFENYIKECYKLLNFVSDYYKMRADKRSNVIHSLINKNLNEKFHSLTLSQKAILLIKSVRGVSCVLVGARDESYVDDVIKILHTEKINNAEEIIKYVSKEIELAEM